MVRGSYNDVDIDEVVDEREHELNNVSEALRIAQGDRQHFLEEVQLQIRKMKNEIVILEKEHEDLVIQLRLVESAPNIHKSERNCEDLANLADNKDWLDQQIEDEKAIHSEVDSKIRDWERKTKVLQLNTGGYESVCAIGNKNKSWIQSLESRLANSRKKYNEILIKNMAMRDKIDALRCERCRFDEIYKKLDIALHKLRLEISELTTKSTEAYEQREDAHSKMVTITDKTQKDNQQHNSEMKELIRYIDQERKLKVFMNQKRLERQEDPQLTAWKAKRAKEAEEKRQEAENSVESYSQAFEHLLDLTKEPYMNRLVEYFIEREDRNFALFNYINELNSEIDFLEKEINNSDDNIARFNRFEVDFVNDFTTQNKLLQDQLAALQRTLSEKMEHCEAIKKTVQAFNGEILRLFGSLGCDRKVLKQKLPSSEGINDSNTMDYLHIIEERINFLMTMSNFITEHDHECGFDSYKLLCNGLYNNPTMQSIASPSLADDFDDGGESEVNILLPFTRRTLHRKVLKLVKKKEQNVLFPNDTADDKPLSDDTSNKS